MIFDLNHRAVMEEFPAIFGHGGKIILMSENGERGARRGLWCGRV